MGINANAVRGILSTVTVDYSDFFSGGEASAVLREPTYLQYLDLQHEELLATDDDEPPEAQKKEAAKTGHAKVEPASTPDSGTKPVPPLTREQEIAKNARSVAIMQWFSANLSSLIVSHTFDVKRNAELASLILENNELLRRTAEVYFPFLETSAAKMR